MMRSARCEKTMRRVVAHPTVVDRLVLLQVADHVTHHLATSTSCVSMALLAQLPMRERRLIIDIAGDIRRLNDIAQFAQQTGEHSLILGDCWMMSLHCELCTLSPGRATLNNNNNNDGDVLSRLRYSTRHDYPWGRRGQAPHLQRQLDAQRRRLFRIHQHWPGIRRQ